MAQEDIIETLCAALHKVPEWARHDFAAADPAARERAADALAAMLAAALQRENDDKN
jgi:hypothetical protein